MIIKPNRWYKRFFTWLMYFLRLRKPPKYYGCGVYSEPVRYERRGNWQYAYDLDGNCIGMCLNEFDTDVNIQDQFKESVLVLGK